MERFQAHPLFSAQVQKGKQALKNEHRVLLVESRAIKATHSLDFDHTLKNKHLQHKRWDYMIQTSSQQIVAFEVHKYDKSALIEKKRGTLAILNTEFPGESPIINSWHVAVLGPLPRQDILARFRAETRINIQRQLDLPKV
jgi:hypothetical protein